MSATIPIDSEDSRRAVKAAMSADGLLLLTVDPGVARYQGPIQRF